MWPTAELHIHIEGTIESELLVRLAKRNDVALPTYDPDELTARYVFADLQSFLDIHYSNLTVLRTEQDFYELGLGYLTRAANAGVRRAEIFFDPQTHIGNGVPFSDVIGGLSAAVAEGERTLGVSGDLLLSFLRDRGPEAAEEMFRTAMPFRDKFIGVALDSTEVGYPPSLFADVYAMAAAEGLHRVAHAGEEAGPEYPALVERLRDERIPLTVCPLSNVALKTAPADLSEHPLRTMLDEGLLVSVNSDDPAYFGGYIDANFSAVVDALELTRGQQATLAYNSFESAFLDPVVRQVYLDEVTAMLTDNASWDS
jgi:adenosine deaminase